MGEPVPAQLAAKAARAAEAVPGVRWLPPFSGAERGFRNKAKLAVGGTVDAPTLGILDTDRCGVDLGECPITDPRILALLPAVRRLIGRAALTPYDVPSRRGELKHVMVTVSPDSECLVRFVLRSTESLPRLSKHLPSLLEEAPGVRVVTANLLPAHAALLEGEEEIVLTAERELPMRVGGLRLRLGPRSFFQTNTEVAAALYAQAAAWADGAASAWDLYCGVGGFGLALAARGTQVVGVEASAEAIGSAARAAADAGVAATFVADDAVAWAARQPGVPDLVVVNPPRRGIGGDLAGWIEASGVPRALYSSCNPATLATDLARMPSLRATRARAFDMFPHTDHLEVMVLLERR